ncbi:MAG: REP-associated tyrosine transposase [Bacillota bacterium]
MTRTARVKSPTDYYHIVMRGNNRERVFGSSENKELFIKCAKMQVDNGLIEIAAYCVMDNHVHLIIKAGIEDLATAMKRINIRYAMIYNEKNDRVGHVFQDRFKSESIADDTYLLQVIRYVHNNPVKAKIVKHPKEYKWSSYCQYFEGVTVVAQEQRDFVMKHFDNRIKAFGEFHEQVDKSEYLEINEDIEKERYEIAQEIISEYFGSNGLTDGKQVMKNYERLEELVTRLLAESRLSHRKIAYLLGVSSNVVHSISYEKIKKQKEQPWQDLTQ